MSRPPAFDLLAVLGVLITRETCDGLAGRDCGKPAWLFDLADEVRRVGRGRILSSHAKQEYAHPSLRDTEVRGVRSNQCRLVASALGGLDDGIDISAMPRMEKARNVLKHEGIGSRLPCNTPDLSNECSSWIGPRHRGARGPVAGFAARPSLPILGFLAVVQPVRSLRERLGGRPADDDQRLVGLDLSEFPQCVPWQGGDIGADDRQVVVDCV